MSKSVMIINVKSKKINQYPFWGKEIRLPIDLYLNVVEGSESF